MDVPAPSSSTTASTSSAAVGASSRRRAARRRLRGGPSGRRRPQIWCNPRGDLVGATQRRSGAGSGRTGLPRVASKAAPPLAFATGVAAVVAEQWCGAARGLTNVVALTAAEHVTSGIMLDGRYWPGAHGLSGSVGWLSIYPVEREDYRRLGRSRGCVPSARIVRRFIWRISRAMSRRSRSSRAICRVSPSIMCSRGRAPG